MTMLPAPDGELLTTRSLAAFLAVGVLLVVIGLSDGGRVNAFVLVGSVVIASNARVLVRRRLQGRRA